MDDRTRLQVEYSQRLSESTAKKLESVGRVFSGYPQTQDVEGRKIIRDLLLSFGQQEVIEAWDNIGWSTNRA